MRAIPVAVFFLLITMVSIETNAQQLLIPYRIKDKFGLSDEKGKLLLAAKYDEIEYLEPGYFEFTIKRTKKDTFRSAYNQFVFQEREDNLHGLIKGTRVIIESAEYKHFFIRSGMIIGSSNAYRPEKCMIYNMAGKALLPNQVNSIEINDTREVGNMTQYNKNLVLLAIFERGENRERFTSIAVYDKIRQTIDQWLIKKAEDFKIDRNKSRQGASFFYCSFSDEKGYHEKLIEFTGEVFVVKDAADIKQNEKKGYGVGNLGDDDMAVVAEVEEGRSAPDLVAPTVVENLTIEEQERRGIVFYQRIKDSVFYIGQNIRKKINQDGIDILFQMKQGTVQNESLLYRKNGKYGLIVRGEFTNPFYDSLVYFGRSFIGGQKTTNGKQYGIIDRSGKEVVPFVYDSIAGEMKDFGFGQSGNADTQRYIYLMNKNHYGSYIDTRFARNESNAILVFKNGKSGLISQNGEQLLPLEYDIIANNSLNFLKQKKSKFILLKKNGKYGVMQLRYDYATQQNKVLNKTEENLPYIPCYYIENYFGKKEFRLFGLYDEHYRFKGYADNTGKLFMQD